MFGRRSLVILVVLGSMRTTCWAGPDPKTRDQAAAAMRKAADFYVNKVATHGGYVYHYSLDLSRRWGEGVATTDQIWVQPPGTPTVGMAYLEAYYATGDRFYLKAATAAAEALVYGQMRSGGWTNCIDFDPRGKRVALYRNGKGRGRNTSSLDDGQTPSALSFIIRTDKAHGFRNHKIHESAMVGLEALLDAQFPNGGFPQIWDDDKVPDPPIRKASYPDYDWRTEGRIKNYWDMYTLNDNVAGYVTQTLLDAFEVYEDVKYLSVLRRLGDFLILAQMPDPQPAWAQQYNYDMKPIWARKFEPPGISGDESQEVIETLITIYNATADERYLEPIPAALDYLERSLLPDGRLARYYELMSNRPLYMTRQGNVYSLTYDDSNLPSHYGWKTESRLAELRAEHEGLRKGQTTRSPEPLDKLQQRVRKIITDLDEKGRWVTTSTGERLVGQAKIRAGDKYLSSAVFSRNLTTLSEYVQATKQP